MLLICTRRWYAMRDEAASRYILYSAMPRKKLAAAAAAFCLIRHAFTAISAAAERLASTAARAYICFVDEPRCRPSSHANAAAFYPRRCYFAVTARLVERAK